MKPHPNTGNQNAAKPASERADTYLNIRVRSADLKRWKREAEKAGVTLSRWAVGRMNGEAD